MPAKSPVFPGPRTARGAVLAILLSNADQTGAEPLRGRVTLAAIVRTLKRKVLEVLLDDELELEDYVVSFRRMYGNARMDAALGSVDGSVRFFGLTPTSMKLDGLDRYHRLIDSYKKLHAARAKAAA